MLEAHGPVDAVGISNQRASVVVWDAATGEPVAPAQGWQDLRTIGECLTLNAEGFRLAPISNTMHASQEELAASVPGMGETLFYLELGR